MIPLVSLLATLATALPPTAPPPGASAIAGSVLAGRIVFVDGSTQVPIPDVRRRLGGQPLGVQLRSGDRIVAAAVADDGLFVGELDPGEWIVEGVASGAKFEFVDPPHEAETRPGEVACIGQLSVTFRDLGAEFGHGTGRWSSSDRCAELAPRLKNLARGRSVRTRLARESAPPAPRRSGWEILAAVRTSAGWWMEGGDGAGGDTLTGTVVFGLNRAVATPGAVCLSASFTQATGEVFGDRLPTRRSLAAGLTYDPLGWLEFMAGPELHLDGGGLGLFGQVRFGSEGFAFFARAAAGGPGRAYFYGIEIAPAWFLGGFL